MEKRGDALAGMGKRAGAAYASSGVAYTLRGVTATAGAMIGMGTGQGASATLGLAGERRLAQRWIGGFATVATLANATAMRFEYGVTDAQAATRQDLATAGDPRLLGVSTAAYAPKSGLKEMRGSAMLSYLATDRTRVMAFAQVSHLANEAAASPIVRQRNGVASGVALAYGF